MTPQIRAEAARLSAHFAAHGAEPVETPILQPADVLLDLYGEDIRARAYVTSDPLRGEMMLRPDFTVPLVRAHMESGRAEARYTYSGEVFRRQEEETGRPSEYIQVGYEVFGGTFPEADAEVFATLHSALEGLELRAVTGDIGLIVAAVAGLNTIEARKRALLRHIWRPRRFRALLERFSGRRPAPAGRAALLAAEDPLAGAGPEIGKRGAREIAARLEALREDAAAAPISEGEVALLDEIMTLSAPLPEAIGALEDIAMSLPSIEAALLRLKQRTEALAARGLAPEALEFEASFGRTALEYYDGFVFGLVAPGRPDLPAVATGGRYDALTRVLGGGRAAPAVGGVIRPELVVELRGSAQ
ncbi:ATP phosphoribosyltransferase regulatory subunit [Pseudoroseicyclus tamaricis]|uniref:Histidine--tRNA ligase n=1 Tax=Pseudoroseicyclus tamaricis TaxID=2705421 RepID=A0A6B2JVN5_9RHOB|nr:ATP phosphoribosyltransferase regulatory subunit [Pseudoroseicyclus tamaricis]NDV02160.1 ATP phosphoribosyltransferase regulatory subunit [Pseudoroseicyclus tamaricis]